MKACIRNWTSVCCVCMEVRGWPPKSFLTFSCWGKVLPAAVCHTDWPANFEMPLSVSHLIEGTLGLQTGPSMPDVAWALGSNFRPHTVKQVLVALSYIPIPSHPILRSRNWVRQGSFLCLHRQYITEGGWNLQTGLQPSFCGLWFGEHKQLNTRWC